MLDTQQSLPPESSRPVSARATSSSPSTSAPADPRSGLVTLRGEIVWWEHEPRAHRRTDRAARATQDADEWWRLVVDGDPPRPRRHRVAVTSGRGRHHRPVGEHGAGRRAGRPVGACVMWMDTRGGPHSRRVVGGPSRATTRSALATWVRRTGGVPSTSGDDPLGHMLHLEHDRPTSPRGRRVVPRARRLPRDALHRRRRRLPHVDDRRLADRQPPARPPRLRRHAGGAWPASTPPSCRRWSPPAR